MTKNVTAQSAPAEEPVMKPINAKFRDRIPHILNEMCEALIIIEPSVKQAKVAVDEFLDYLDFEIKKTVLEISRVTWECKADKQELDDLNAWKSRLESIRDDFRSMDVSGSPDFINGLAQRIRDTFQ